MVHGHRARNGKTGAPPSNYTTYLQLQWGRNAWVFRRSAVVRSLKTGVNSFGVAIGMETYCRRAGNPNEIISPGSAVRRSVRHSCVYGGESDRRSHLAQVHLPVGIHPVFQAQSYHKFPESFQSVPSSLPAQ